jgi:general L-amino acid transport system permease protein
MPQQTINPLQWLRSNLFNTWYNALISVALIWLIAQAIFALISWAATTQGWVAVVNNWRLLATGLYPPELLWRVQLVVWIIALMLGLSAGLWQGMMRVLAIGFGTIMLALAAYALTLPPDSTTKLIPTSLFYVLSSVLVAGGYALGGRAGERMRWPLLIAWFLAYPVAIGLIRGFGPLTLVGTNLWGGLLLTMVLSLTAIVASFPLGVLLALGRRSDLPVVKGFCIAYIELIRGVPLVTVLFMAQLMLPLFIAGGESIDKVVRAIVALTLFSAAYLAENVRGGLQSIPKGQIEAARAVGLNTVQTTLLITLPQALRAVIPVLVSQFISLFKDTSLVAILGLADLLGIAQTIVNQPDWLGIPGGVWRETFLVVALIYWVFSFTMSRTARSVEQQLNVGKQ